MNRQEAKEAIRKTILEIRDGLAPEARIEKSLIAADHAAEFLSFEPGTVISGFFPIRSEIDARPLMDMLRRRGARLCLPVVLDKTNIEFRELVRGAELIATGFGTSGPSSEAAVLDPQILIMPLAAFDKTGGRIGYGAGYYDRAIAKLKSKGLIPSLIGLAFTCQFVDEVPIEPHDVPLDAAITEDGVFALGK